MIMTFEATVIKLETAPESMILIALEACDTYHISRGGFQFLAPFDSEVTNNLTIGQNIRLVLNTEK